MYACGATSRGQYGWPLARQRRSGVIVSVSTKKNGNAKALPWIEQPPVCGRLIIGSSEHSLEQLGHFRWVAGHFEAALFHDGQFGVSRVCAA